MKSNGDPKQIPRRRPNRSLRDSPIPGRRATGASERWMASCNTENSPLLEHDTAINGPHCRTGPWQQIERKDKEHEHVQGDVDQAHNQVQRVIDCDGSNTSRSIRSGWCIRMSTLHIAECYLAPRCLPTMLVAAATQCDHVPWKHHVPLTQPLEHHRPQAELLHHLVGRIRPTCRALLLSGPAQPVS